jgi:hypothetical protein
MFGGDGHEKIQLKDIYSMHRVCLCINNFITSKYGWKSGAERTSRTNDEAARSG